MMHWDKKRGWMHGRLCAELGSMQTRFGWEAIASGSITYTLQVSLHYVLDHSYLLSRGQSELRSSMIDRFERSPTEANAPMPGHRSPWTTGRTDSQSPNLQRTASEMQVRTTGEGQLTAISNRQLD
jgi:hypothetical protein